MQPSRIGVFCSSSSQTPQKYINAAYQLGALLSARQIEIWYGGGAIGEMGALANGALDNEGRIIGVIPTFMVELEWGNPRATRLIECNDLSERKNIIIEHCDAFIALPGGTGTLDELADVLSRKKLGLIDKPIVILNIDDFYNPIKILLQRMINDKLISDIHINFVSLVDTVEDILPAIDSYTPIGKETAQKLAAL